ncbi:MAG: peptide chain release factor N(5)-glutamine methyltransferase [Clostridiales bacterium]|nr:peptide chain release factor N(5)-glutamine methyltransferase [Clostridiales bacterium]
MTIREILKAATARLDAAGVLSGDYDAAVMLAHVMGEDALMLRMNSWKAMPEDKLEEYEAIIARRETREPMQYILSSTGFMGLEFHVEPGVLIPRPDTEILCEEALRRLKPGARVLDIGTGSGALAVSIAKLGKDCQVTAVDVSDAALAIAQGNAERNGAQVRFVKSDCFAALEGETFDMIVSNPPYINREEMAELMPEVLQEPELALFGGEDGLDFYRRISREAGAHLKKGGCLLFEIGWQQKDAVSALLSEHIGEPFALKDYGDNWRVVGAVKEN